MTTSTPVALTGLKLTPAQRNLSLISLILAVLLASMNQTIVSTAGPAIQKALGIENSLYSWITTAYLLASTTLVPIYGKLSDLWGRKVILIFGTVLFILGSIVCGLADGVGGLIAGRAVQGLGGAALIGLMYAVIADLYLPEERGRYTGIIGAVFSLSTVLGAVVGGYVTDHFGWHNVFFISVPLGIAALAFMLFMPALRQERERAPIDVPGVLLLSVFSISLLLALSLGKTAVAPGESGFLWGSWQILSLGAVALVTFLAFLATERRAADPIIDIRMFKDRTFSVAMAITFLLGVVFFAATVFLPLFMVNVIGLSATNAGLTTFPLTIGLVLSSIVAGQVFARTGGIKPIIVLGTVILLIGFALMGWTLSPQSTQFELTWKMIVVGLGLGPVLPMLTLAIQGTVHPRDIGSATGASNFLRSLGSTIGVAILGTLFASTLKDNIQTSVTAATTTLPAAVRSQFSPAGGASAGSQGFDAAQVKRQVNERFDTQRDLYTSALRDGNQAAIQKMLADPQTPEQLRAVLNQGGFPGAIDAQFEAQRQLLRRAIVGREPAAIAAVVQSPQTPAQVRTLAQTGAGDQGPQAFAQVEAGLVAQQQAARATQPAVLLAPVLKGLETTRADILPVIDRVGLGIKQAFTGSVELLYQVGLGITVLALLLSFLLPEAKPREVTRETLLEDEFRSTEIGTD
ncbi:DHA2 family efflux MFS transporter permease subunit [Deinococcus sp. HMF7620]|uniref:DHA2 family efflux MFS transporter permease subunit n=1 Tax=Deinococcus arboris TaxID=2682977 RepID=A0A7C9MPJ0_9DEIO|nr:MDR family MFS transporter [Deinococcus arboris]MVN85624.1 DHA2 family efflux MFS transporter permease subunit [Deinococcus arboris]